MFHTTCLFYFLLLFIFNLINCNPKIVSNSEPSKNVLHSALERSVTIHYHISDTAKGTGLLLDEEGYILTAHHVILGWEDRVRISQDSKTFYDAILVRAEPKLDLALLKSTLTKKLPSISWVDRSELATNDSIFIFGSSWGLANSFLKGYISHTDRTGFDIRMPTIPYIQTMGTSFPGCSGAAVYTLEGGIIGINRATVGFEAGNSTGLVIPTGYVKAFLKASHPENLK